MKCENFMDAYTALDNGERPSLSLRLHLRSCPRCRREAALMEEKLSSLRRDAALPDAPDRTREIMARISAGDVTYGRSVPLYNWVSGELIIIVSIVLARFSDSLVWMNGYFGMNLEIPFNIVLGVVLTVYSSLFIGSHMKEIKSFLDRYRLRQP